MAHPILTPRLNNNDDEVRLTRVLVRPGDSVSVGQPLAEVETDKASIAVDCDRSGYVLRVNHDVDAMIQVGCVLVWIGDSADEAAPSADAPASSPTANESKAEPTAKALLLLAQHGLDAAEVPAIGARLTAADVEAYISSRIGKPAEPTRPTQKPAEQSKPAAVLPVAAGSLQPLSMEERGMLRSVLWHRDEAVPAYLEIAIDQQPWQDYAKAFAAQRRLLGDPLLPLMAQRLVAVARDHPRLNSTIVDERRYAYQSVNLGFTIQVQDNLYLVVVQEAEKLQPPAFVDALNRLHKKAIAHQLEPKDLHGATVAFTSMARWRVDRHVPILPAHVSMIVAHTVSNDNRAVLGATYDHRVLSGADAVAILNRLAKPPDEDSIKP